MTTACRTAHPRRTYLDVLIDRAWSIAEEVFIEPSNREAKARLVAIRAEIDRVRAVTGE